MKGILSQANAVAVRARRLIYDHRSRAKKAGVALRYTVADIRRLLESSSCCTYCGLPVAWDAQLDHKTPIARGGRHQLDNLAVCCSRCNAIKGQLTEAEFRELLMVLALLHPTARTDLERRLIAGGRRYAKGRGKRATT